MDNEVIIYCEVLMNTPVPSPVFCELAAMVRESIEDQLLKLLVLLITLCLPLNVLDLSTVLFVNSCDPEISN